MGQLLCKHQDQEGYGLSYDLWKGFPAHEILVLQDRNVGIGFFDDFLKVGNTSLYDGYIRVQTGSGTVAQVASIADTVAGDKKGARGICRLLTGAADLDEAIIGYGAGLDAPFKLVTGDLCFECRVAWSNITVDAHGQFVGLGELGTGVTLKVLDNADPPVICNDYDLIGFQRLQGETSALDAMYQVGGQTKVDGAVNTNLDTLHTIVITEYVKLGFRFRAGTNSLHWFINGVEQADAKLGTAVLAAATFPNDNFMTPVAANVNDGTAACNFDMDWWACAQET